jgi:hypothetical protein
MRRIPRTVVHYSWQHPETSRGGVESFARNLRLIFERVEFMTPETRDEARVRAEHLPVICDNHMVLDWPADLTVIGFQHGVAWRKARVTRSTYDLKLGWRQLRAARRPKVIWVACARWIADAFARFTACESTRVIYHPVDLERFDGKLDNHGSKLVLHDGRSQHKGQHLLEALAQRLPGYRFEPLDCAPADVPERMRHALAFVHLSRYEGNSIVCNEAMAMNLSCLLTRVGLMLDGAEQFDVETIEAGLAFGNIDELTERTRAFLARAEQAPRSPRPWVEQNASRALTVARWEEVLSAFDARSSP